MSVSIKSKREIEIMREAGRILGTVMRDLSKEIKPGMSTYTVDKLGEEMIRSYGCIPSCKGYEGYPAAFCISVNEAVVHSIPSKKIILKEGDIVSLDACLEYKGYQADAARTVGVGQISDEAAKLIEVTKQSFFEGIKYAKEGCHLHEISNAIAAYNESFGYGVIRDLVGHGIGTQMHEDPPIPGYEIEWLDDDWTAVTADRSLAAHYENTVLVTKDGPDVLTLVD